MLWAAPKGLTSFPKSFSSISEGHHWLKHPYKQNALIGEGSKPAIADVSDGVAGSASPGILLPLVSVQLCDAGAH